VSRFTSHWGPAGDEDGWELGILKRRSLFEPAGRSIPVGPVPGDLVVMMAASPGEWDEDVQTVESVMDNGEDGGWAVTIDGDGYIIQRGGDGRWWTFGALSEQGAR
jgi:hypothetical protein